MLSGIMMLIVHEDGVQTGVKIIIPSTLKKSTGKKMIKMNTPLRRKHANICVKTLAATTYLKLGSIPNN